ncbi:NlpC/P60 family protein [Clostridium sp. AM58-1XD]|uniref:C40 family peptidase n=1 Tax=Clostridium sp. AM58-1XD TaxID=2292307 RepID=UPI000E4A6425|nr:NlpC/P60 family protein [Clostridium sp. AM58-1XD]RGY99841.1 hydrolase [Clostridium sp. AM58-1XD]
MKKRWKTLLFFSCFMTFGGTMISHAPMTLRAEGAAQTAPAVLDKSRKTDVPRVTATEQTYDNVAISQVTDYVNVRQEANTKSTIVGKIYNDCAATILNTVDGEGGKWYQIQSGSVQGYIKAQYFITGDEAAKIAKQVGTSYATVINATTLRLHEQPDLNSKTLTLLSQGARYQVIEENGEFAKLQIDTDLEGYVSKEYINITVEFRQAVSVEEEAAKAAEDQKLKQEAAQAIQDLEDAKKKAGESKNNTSSGSSGSGGVIEANPEGNGQSNNVAAPPVASGGSQSGDNSQSGSGSGGPTSSEVGPGGSGGSSGPYVSDGVTSATRSAIVAYAKQFLGNPYVYGGTSLTSGADCSGFVMSVFEHFGITTGRSSRDQAAKGKEIPVYSVQPGDLLFYSSGDYINHVGIYIGGGQIIHSSTPKTGITITKSNYRTPCKAVTFLN